MTNNIQNSSSSHDYGCPTSQETKQWLPLQKCEHKIHWINIPTKLSVCCVGNYDIQKNPPLILYFRREGGGCGFTLSRSHSCCAVRLVYVQISPGHIWTTLYYPRNNPPAHRKDTPQPTVYTFTWTQKQHKLSWPATNLTTWQNRHWHILQTHNHRYNYQLHIQSAQRTQNGRLPLHD